MSAAIEVRNKYNNSLRKHYFYSLQSLYLEILFMTSSENPLGNEHKEHCP